jgi:hypothetical protein
LHQWFHLAQADLLLLLLLLLPAVRVSTAQRMESNGFPGCVHISPSTHAALRVAGGCRYALLDCGPRVLKDKGVMRTYVVEVSHQGLHGVDHE